MNNTKKIIIYISVPQQLFPNFYGKVYQLSMVYMESKNQFTVPNFCAYNFYLLILIHSKFISFNFSHTKCILIPSFFPLHIILTFSFFQGFLTTSPLAAHPCKNILESILNIEIKHSLIKPAINREFLIVSPDLEDQTHPTPQRCEGDETTSASGTTAPCTQINENQINK